MKQPFILLTAYLMNHVFQKNLIEKNVRSSQPCISMNVFGKAEVLTVNVTYHSEERILSMFYYVKFPLDM